MRMLAVALLIAAGPAMAETALVAPSAKLCAGQKVERTQFFTFLSTTEKCSLPIVNAEHMLAFHEAQPKNAIVKYAAGKGCWGKTLRGDAVFVYDDGRTGANPIDVYAKVRFDGQGNGVVLDAPMQNRGVTKCN